MKNWYQRFAAAVLSAVLLLAAVPLAVSAAPASGNQPTQVGINEYTNDYDVDHYEEVASDGGLTLFADKSSGKIAVRNDKTGFIWYSTPNDRQMDSATGAVLGSALDSTLVVSYVNMENEARVASASQVSSHDCVADGSVQVETIDRGVRITYDFNSVGMRVPVEIQLDNGTMVARIPLADVLVNETFIAAKRQEGWTDEDVDAMLPSYLISLWLLPGFGAQNSQANGYIFVPDGSGALVDFAPGYAAPAGRYSKRVYGEELAQSTVKLTEYGQQVYMPVFGTVVGSDGVCGIIEEGDTIANIEAYGSSGTCGYTGVSASLYLRDLYSSYLYQGTSNEREVKRVSTNEVKTEQFRVRYTFLQDDAASYVGMAQLYRRYLETKGMQRKETTPSFNVDLVGCVETEANFLGFSYMKKLPMTTFAQAEEILDAMQQAGMTDIHTRLLGWTNNGLKNRKASTTAKPLAKLGGRSKFLSLAEKASAAGSFAPDVDLVHFQTSGNGIQARQMCVKTVFGLPAYQYSFMPSVLVYKNDVTPDRLLSAAGLQKATALFQKNYAKLGMKNLSLSYITQELYSNFGKENVYRDEMVEQLTAVLQTYAADWKLTGTASNAYTVPYLERVLDVPLDSSGYDFFDRDVPFYSMVFHGYAALAGSRMNHSYDMQQSFLKSVETGSELHFVGMYEDSAKLKETDYTEYYSTTYTLWLDKAAAFWKDYQPLLQRVQNSTITDHGMAAEQVSRTVYDNGVTVYVNYGTAEYTAADGTQVAARSYAYTGGAQ